MSFQDQVMKSKLWGSGMFNREDRYSRVDINHIPVMITDKNKILCIPDSKEMTHIAFTAMTAKGKGIGGNALLGFEYWMKGRHCMILNDYQRETFEYSLPCKNQMFKSVTSAVNVEPRPYPMVYVFPSNRDLVISETMKKFPHTQMSIPADLVIRDIEKYYKLDKTKKYLTANIEKFIDCNDLDEVRDVLNEIIPDNKFEEMKYKILTVFKNIFDERICNSSAPEAPAFLRIRKRNIGEYQNLLVQSLIVAGFIPSIQTSDIRDKEWFSAYMSFIVNSIYNDKYRDPILKDINLSMYVPEIDKMWRGHNGEYIKKALSLIGTNGRMAGIGLRWDTQDYEQVPDSIRNNTKYLFVLRKSNAEEVRVIKKDFNVDKETEGHILSLNTEPANGLFECVALTTDRFILYSLRDGSMSTTNEPQRGRLITPIAQHRVPGVPVEDLI